MTSNKDEMHPPSWMSNEFFENVLRSSEGSDRLEVTNTRIEPGTKAGDHYCSAMFRARVHFKCLSDDTNNAVREKSLIIKTIPESEGFKREFLTNCKMFQTEATMYKTVLPEMHRLLMSLGDDTQIAPRLLYSAREPEVVMVFEDICTLGYTTKSSQLGLPEAKLLYDKLAKFHAVSMLLEDSLPILKQLNTGLGNLRIETFEAIWRDNFSSLGKICQTWPGYEKFADKLETIKAPIIDRLEEIYSFQESSVYHVLNHGDLFYKNMMFKMVDDVPQEMLLLDYQMSVWGSPAIDLIYSLYDACSVDTRDNHRDELISFYHECLMESLKKLGYTSKIPSLEELQVEITKNGHLELFLVVAFMPIMVLKVEELMPNVAEQAAEGFEANPEDLDGNVMSTAMQHPKVAPVLRRYLPKFLERGLLDLYVEAYVNELMSTSHKLRNVGFDVNDSWLAAILLMGLPEQYEPMIMGLEASGTALTSDAVKAKILQDVKLERGSVGSSTDGALYSKMNRKKSSESKDGVKNEKLCYNCEKPVHFAIKCPLKRTKGSKPKRFCSIFAIGDVKADEWYLDSRATVHMARADQSFVNVVTMEHDVGTANNGNMKAVAKGTVIFMAKKFEIWDESGELVITGTEEGGLYQRQEDEDPAYRQRDGVRKLRLPKDSGARGYPASNYLSIHAAAKRRRREDEPYTGGESMLNDAKLGKEYWAEAVATVAYVVNRCPTRCLNNKTPEEAWSGKRANLRHLKVFGSRVTTHIPKAKRKKFDPKAKNGIFVGYCEDTKGYRVYDPERNEFQISRDVVILAEGGANTRAAYRITIRGQGNFRHNAGGRQRAKRHHRSLVNWAKFTNSDPTWYHGSDPRGNEVSSSNSSRDKQMAFNKDELNAPAWMDGPFFETVLKQSSKHAEQLSVEKFHIVPGSNFGDHYASVIFRAIVSYKVRDQSHEVSLIIKTIPEQDGPKRDLLKDGAFFQTETFMYEKVLFEMHRLLKSVGDGTELGARLVYSAKEPRLVMVFEDACPRGFRTRAQQLNFEESQILYAKLARIHALSMHLIDEIPAIKNLVKGVGNMPPGNFAKIWVNNFAILADVCEKWPGYEQYPEKLREIRHHIMKKMNQTYTASESSLYQVLNHGDLHCKNMMFKIEEGETKDILLIDYQVSIWGTPALDILYSMYNAVSSEVRDQHRDELISFYYEEFSSTLRKVGYLKKIPTLLDLHIEITKCGHLETFLSVAFLPLMTVMAMGPPKAEKQDETREFEIANVDQMYDLTKMTFEHPKVVGMLKSYLPTLLHKGLLDL
ncbi:uncharacterized protein LOC129753699 [Uranotaenia lowii]|uniref:uncharacterized protein LOC129753699 n=1 Tax=Uranotaenia lowii TaxID=190385 RepID=UPI00247A5607|nr:uncharacterized protein LOC129753699 [Uranotaenia lowii]